MLIKLLSFRQPPRFISFISAYAEGSEYAILEALDLKALKSGTMCVEHNFNFKSIYAIQDLLANNAYQSKHVNASPWDDWCVCTNSQVLLVGSV